MARVAARSETGSGEGCDPFADTDAGDTHVFRGMDTALSGFRVARDSHSHCTPAHAATIRAVSNRDGRDVRFRQGTKWPSASGHGSVARSPRKVPVGVSTPSIAAVNAPVELSKTSSVPASQQLT